MTPDPIQQKKAQTVASRSIAPGCVQFLGDEKRFHTAWIKTGKAQCEQMFSALPPRADIVCHSAYVRKMPILLQKSFCEVGLKFSDP